MVANFPSSLPTFSSGQVDNVDVIYAELYNFIARELNALFTEIGTDPAGASATVADRIEEIETAMIAYLNAEFLRWKDSGGTIRNVMRVDSNDDVYIGQLTTGWGDDVVIRASDLVILQAYNAIGSWVTAAAFSELLSRFYVPAQFDDDVDFIQDVDVTGALNANGGGDVNSAIVRAYSHNLIGRTVQLSVQNAAGGWFFIVPPALDGWNLTYIRVNVYSSGTGACAFDFNNNAVSMLTANMSLAGGSVSVEGTIDTAADDVATGDRLTADIVSVGATPPYGLTVTFEFEKP